MANRDWADEFAKRFEHFLQLNGKIVLHPETFHDTLVQCARQARAEGRREMRERAGALAHRTPVWEHGNLAKAIWELPVDDDDRALAQQDALAKPQGE